VLLFYFGLMSEAGDPNAAAYQLWVAYALAFSAGTFLCISLSDLLPELQFHHHDRVNLSAALLLGLAVAWAAGWLEAAAHAEHVHGVATGGPPVAAFRMAAATGEPPVTTSAQAETPISASLAMSHST
jgi:hypothetical protein